MRKIIRYTLGFCPCCERYTVFVATDYWLRDHYHCLRCRSIPRQRALMSVLKNVLPGYKTLNIHESSPSGSPFLKLKGDCDNYSFSYYYPEEPLGKILEGGASNQNLEKLTFADDTFDVFITQDVMEHVIDPCQAFREISRVLKGGGVYIFTTPIYKFAKTRPRIKMDGEEIINILPAIYHGNPIDEKGALVTYDWGYDIAKIIEKASGMKVEIKEFKNSKTNYRLGLEADFLEVIVCKKRM